MSLAAPIATSVARLICDEPTARRLATFLNECLDPDDTACAAFEGDDGRWQVAIHFRDAPDEAGLRDLLRSAGDMQAAASLRIEPVEPADWVAKSLAGLAPVRAGRFVVHGAHDRTKLRPNEIGIEIEAALAFGTGHHGTTRGCLLALDSLAKRQHSRRGLRVLDIGTGSGVLAIAAAKILRTRIVAGDIDRVAVNAARANFQLNHVAPWIMPVHAVGTRSRAMHTNAPYDLIFANILLGPLTRLAVAINSLVAPGGRVVLSGLLPSHANGALAAYRAQGLRLEQRVPLDGWMTLVLRR